VNEIIIFPVARSAGERRAYRRLEDGPAVLYSWTPNHHALGTLFGIRHWGRAQHQQHCL